MSPSNPATELAIQRNDKGVMHNKIKLLLLCITAITAFLAILNMVPLPIELRFQKPEYNYLFVMVLYATLPVAISMVSLTFKRRSSRYLGLMVGVMLALPSYLIYTFASYSYEDIKSQGVDLSFEKINELAQNESTYRLYRTNGGATTAYGLVLRRERALVPGINVVQVLFSRYRASDGTLSALDDNTLALKMDTYSNGEKMEVVIFDI